MTTYNVIAHVTKRRNLFGGAQVKKSISEVLIILCIQNLINHRS